MSSLLTKGLLALLAGIVLVVLFALIISLPVMWLWNWLMPVIFGLKTITWLQTLGLLVLSGLLLKSHTSSSKSS